jgi:hypothetical protein
MKTASLSNAEQERVKEALRRTINSLIRGCEALDMELAFSVFSDSPDFLMMGTDGSLCNYQTYVTNNVDYLTMCSSFELTTFGEEIRILDSDTAIFSWAYGAKATLMTGEQDVIENAGATFVFRKLENEWKVVYYHESSLPATRLPKGE